MATTKRLAQSLESENEMNFPIDKTDEFESRQDAVKPKMSETKIPDDLNRLLGRLALIKRVATLEVREKELREEITGLHHDLETVRSAARIYREERDSLRAQLAEAQRPVSDGEWYAQAQHPDFAALGLQTINRIIAARAAKATKHGNPNGE